MRINTVQKARKAPGRCGKCGVELGVGDAYRWIKPRYGVRQVRCTKTECVFRPSDMTSSDKLATLYSVQERIEDLDLKTYSACDELAADLREMAEEARGVAEEYNESADNQEEYFPGSYQADEIREKGQSAEGWADEIEQAADTIEDLENEEPDDEEDRDWRGDAEILVSDAAGALSI